MTEHAGRRANCLALVALWALIFARPAYAYLDPGTGAFLFQLLIAGLVGGLFAVKLFWKRIASFFARLFSRKPHASGGNQ